MIETATASLPTTATALPGYRDGRRAFRSRRRQWSNDRARTSVDPAVVRDPLARPAGDPARRLAAALLFVIASIGLHAAVVLVARLWPADVVRPKDEPIQVEMISPPPPPPPVKVVEPVRLPDPVRPPPVVIKTPPKLTHHPTPPPVVKQEPPPDPVNLAPPPPTPPPPQPVRRIVGLSMDSTVTGGTGPSFSVGNTRMGQTAVIAEDPSSVQPLAPTFTPAVRKSSVKPEYPADLRAKGIQGDVGLEVELDVSGKVGKVTVVAPSEFDELNTAAVASARQGVYEPARVNGVPVANVIRFSVHFRLHE